MYKILLTFILTSVSFLAFGQDTITVQAFNYDSATRDSMISFPEGDHNQYRKIIMSYNMRCKEGLVSTTSNRNRGCGEWDYSCNTSIIDSSIIDSLIVTHPDHIIIGYNEELFPYVSTPIYDYYQRNLQEVEVTGTNNEIIQRIGNNDLQEPSLFGSQLNQKAYYLIPSSRLEELQGGSIGALSFDGVTLADNIDYLKIQLATTESSSLDLNFLNKTAFETVFYDNVSSATITDNALVFYKDFNYATGQNIVVQLSFSTKERSSNSTSNASEMADVDVLVHNDEEQYIHLTNNYLDIPTDKLSDIQNEITIAMWVNGNEDALPKNTSIIFGTNDSNNRQINIHLPWSNGSVFWDCGGTGSTYDRVNKAATPSSYRGKWNHWAFTKNASTGDMVIYLNGEEWQRGSGKFHPIDIKNLRIGANFQERNLYDGALDDIMIYDRALDSDAIKSIARFRPLEGDANYQNLKLFFDFNEVSDLQAVDQSPSNITATFNSPPRVLATRGDDIFKDFTRLTVAPNIKLHTGDYARKITSNTVVDSVQLFPYEIQPFEVEGTDLVQRPSFYYWLAGQIYTFDDDGNKIDSTTIEEEDYVVVGELEYYQKNPSKYELLSFVTPYGIGLDFGLDGKTWTFDVTDFGPILKGDKRIIMDRGGQWQEQMDIKFHFIKGTPTRDVQHIHQIWPVQSISNAAILQNLRFEKRTIPLSPSVNTAKLRMAITGHGQEGEFIPRVHSLNINGGPAEYQWQVWTECSDNPVYPQGGTWVYDRAGWCPGAPTDVEEHEIIDLVAGDQDFDIDYSMGTANGDSRYIINGQLVKYGAPNFDLDASIERIISPSNYVEYERINPSCQKPRILIKNTGKQKVNSVWIAYGVEGTQTISYEWKGSLDYLESTEVELPSFPEGRWSRGNVFNARISLVNGVNDGDPSNNQMSSHFVQTPHHNGNIIVVMRTNNAPNETQWYLRDESGAIIASRTSGLSSSQVYTDTITNLDGCYSLQFVDSDQDGISWWANGDGNGSIRVREEGGEWNILQPDFGAELTYNFTSGMTTNIKDIEEEASINIAPNPTSGLFYVEIKGYDTVKARLIDGTGRLIIDRDHTGRSDYDEFSLDISDQPAGIYYLIVSTNSQNTVSKKIIKI